MTVASARLIHRKLKQRPENPPPALSMPTRNSGAKRAQTESPKSTRGSGRGAIPPSGWTGKARPQHLCSLRKAAGGTERQDESGDRHREGAAEDSLQGRLTKDMAHRDDPGEPAFFCLWLVMWSNSSCKISNARKSTEFKMKSTVLGGKRWILCGYYPNINRRPHPYQPAKENFYNLFRLFPTVSVPAHFLSGTL